MNDMLRTSLPALLQTSQAAVTTDFRAELREMRCPDAADPRGLATPPGRSRSPGAKAVGADTGRGVQVYENAPHGLVVTHPRQFEADLVDFIKA